MNSAKVAAIIPAAGSGSRMGLPSPKQFLELDGTPILIRTLKVFQQAEAIGRIIVVVPRENCTRVEALVRQYALAKVTRVIPGGERRQDSVRAGMEALPAEVELVVVHDGVRPFVSAPIIESCVQEAEKSGAAMVAVPVKDTLKSVSRENLIEHTINRTGVWQAQTPQAVRRSLLEEAYARAAAEGDFAATDEAGLLELLGYQVRVVEGSERNIKITRPEDLILAEAILMESQKDAKSPAGCRCRSGYGYDAHQLVPDRPLILGGVQVAHAKGLLGHSDADVLTHALCDAMLGAAGAGDIGVHFPDSDKKYKDISSLEILEAVAGMLAARGYALHNADITVVAQKPRLAGYFTAMRENLGAACGVDPALINLKATTTENMGFEGREEGMSAHAVVLLKKL